MWLYFDRSPILRYSQDSFKTSTPYKRFLFITQDQFEIQYWASQFYNHKNKLEFWYEFHPIILSFAKLKIFSLYHHIAYYIIGSIKFLSHPHPFYSKERRTKWFLHTRTKSTTENRKLVFLLYMSWIESESRFSYSFRSLVRK